MIRVARRALNYAYYKSNMDTLQRMLSVRLSPHRWYSEVPPDFLVIGLQKSGTYWVTALLDEHPDITALPARPGGATGVKEGHFFDTLGAIDSDPAWYRMVFATKHDAFFRDIVGLTERLDRTELYDRYRRRYNAYIQQHRKTRLVGDKTAEYVFHLDLVDKLYPGIKKICILRDPRDRAVSFHFHQLRKKQIDNAEITDREVDEYAQRIVHEFTVLADYDAPLFLCTYEQLSADEPRVVTDMLEYLGASAEPTQVQRMISAASFQELSGRSNGASDESSHFRKGEVGDWANYLTDAQTSRLIATVSMPTRRLMDRREIDLSSYLS